MLASSFIKYGFSFKKSIFWPAIFLTLSACSTMQDSPADIGTGTDDLKQSPCAQCEKEPFYVNGRWVD